VGHQPNVHYIFLVSQEHVRHQKRCRSPSSQSESLQRGWTPFPARFYGGRSARCLDLRNLALGEAAVLLDVRDAFDPVSASQNGVVLSQLLWVRPGGGASATSTRRRFAALDQILMAADLLLQSGGFGLVVLDLASLDPRDTVKIPLTTWFRLRRAVDETRTLLLVLEQEPHAGSSAAVVLDLAQAGVKFLETRTTTGTAQHVDGDCLIESIALDAEVVRGQARKPVASVRSRASFSTSLQFYR